MSVPKFGMLTDSGEDIVREIRRANALGFDYVELGFEPPEGAPEKLVQKRKKIIEELKKFSCPPVVHNAYWVDLGSMYETVRKAWMLEMKKSVVLAKSLGAGKMNVHLAAKGILNQREYAEAVLGSYIKSLKMLAAFSKKFGIKIMLENVPHSHSNFENYRHVADSVEGLGVHLDIGHAFITDGSTGISRFIRYFSDRIEHIHVSDNGGAVDEHLPLGAGRINFPAVVGELKKIGYDKTITFEVFTGEKHLVSSVNAFRRLWLS